MSDKLFRNLQFYAAVVLGLAFLVFPPKAKPRGTLTAAEATGTICGTAVHCVVLTWTASSDAAANPTLGYNIYKGTTSGGESTAALNGSTLSSVGCATATSTPPCEYVDTEVAVGQTIYYDIKASLNGVLSVASNEVTTEIGPAPPTAVSLASQ